MAHNSITHEMAAAINITMVRTCEVQVQICARLLHLDFVNPCRVVVQKLRGPCFKVCIVRSTAQEAHAANPCESRVGRS